MTLLITFIALSVILLSSLISIFRRKSIPEWCEKFSKYILFFLPAALASFNNDTHWMIAVGRNLIKYGYDCRDRINFYSYHSIAQQHALDILFAWLHSAGGKMAVTVFSGAVCALFETVLFHALKKRTAFPGLITFMAVGLLAPYVTTRPLLLSVFLLLLECIILDDYAHRKTDRLWLIPLLALVFINTHMALWPMQIIFIGTYIAEWIWEKCRKKETFNVLPVLLLIPSVCAVSMINPYGAEGFMYPFSLYSHDLSFISEIQPISFANPVCIGANAVALFTIILVMQRYIFRTGKISFSASSVLTAAGTWGMTSKNFRHVALAAAGTPLFLCSLLEPYRLEKPVRRSYKSQISAAVIGCLLIACGASVSFRTGSDYEGAVDVLKKQKDIKKARIYSSINTGGYIAYRGLRSYMDARTEPHYRNYNHQFDWYNEWLDVYYGRTSFAVLIRKYHFSYALLDKATGYEKAYLKKCGHARRIYHEKGSKNEVWKIDWKNICREQKESGS